VAEYEGVLFFQLFWTFHRFSPKNGFGVEQGVEEKTQNEWKSIKMADAPHNQIPLTSLAELLEKKPACVRFEISDAKVEPQKVTPLYGTLYLPVLYLLCNNESCAGFRYFRPVNGESYNLRLNQQYTACLEYLCRNCSISQKIYAVMFEYASKESRLFAVKFGELPSFSPHLPPRLRKLIGPDQDKFDKGLRSEALGFGVGAFGYYRQVVENQKDRLIDEIRKVANLGNPPPELITELNAAKSETRFSSAVEKIKHAIPAVLLINGHNPLTLLHTALSKGLHAGTDEECLEIAQDIRVVLSEFSERLQMALKDQQELKSAVSRILNRPTKQN
jgi:hypothetical protein